ncbi:hypothetical protein [Sulfitobacter sp. R18_1]|uniref:hypothetical protein n=1 Tax=Sulfitobacter sp. R18_1 TaxID=2821104 RepID=UPI001ADBCE77|nr:hypothetical protein [Sulfitobacter sp. R18_1]MBO9428692.1 hypothetical protein [Sulfitobacter sp. R18_1]
MKPRKDDPMEKMLRDGLIAGDFAFTEDGKPGSEVNKALDFHLSEEGVHIEVKQFHSDRISKQMARSDNIIAAQGAVAVKFLADLLANARIAEERDTALREVARLKELLREPERHEQDI